jgi:hypothetical protein
VNLASTPCLGMARRGTPTFQVAGGWPDLGRPASSQDNQRKWLKNPNVAFSPDGKTLALASRSGSVQL